METDMQRVLAAAAVKFIDPPALTRTRPVRMEETIGEVIHLESRGSGLVRITVSLQDQTPLSRLPQDATLAALPPADLQRLLEAALRETLLRLSL